MNSRHATSSHPKYRADIDGIRAVAVGSVVVFHAFPHALRGGFVGVDIFFVISGFLISSIIFGGLEKGSFSFREFYSRRIRRIFPALLLVMGTTLGLGWTFLLAEEFQTLGGHVAAAAGFISNFVLWGESGYFDGAADLKPLLHLWSLAIEEQFYLFWPLLVWLCWRSKRVLLALLVGGAGLSFAFNVHMVQTDAVAAFYSPLSRFWELLAGSLLSFLTRGHFFPVAEFGQRARNLVSVAGLGLIAAALALTSKDHAFPGWWALLPVMGTVLLIAAGENGLVNRVLLARRAMVWVGLISFPLYLWHWPLLAFARIVEGGTPRVSVRLACVALAVLLAWLTCRYWEKPLRFGRLPGQQTAGLAGVMAGAGALGVALLLSGGVVQTRISDRVNPEWVKAVGDWDFPGQLKADAAAGKDVYVSSGESPRILFVGDSHVEHIAPRVAQWTGGPAAQPVAFMTGGGCPPIPGVREDSHPWCADFMARVEGYLQAHPGIDTVVLGACWNCYFLLETSAPVEGGKKFNYYLLADGGKTYFRSPGAGDALMEKFSGLLSRLASRHQVFVLLDTPMDERFNPARALGGGRLQLALGSARGAPAFEAEFDVAPDQLALDETLTRVVRNAGAWPIGQLDMVCPAGKCRNTDALGRPIYKDANHLRPFFVRERMEGLDIIFKSGRRKPDVLASHGEAAVSR